MLARIARDPHDFDVTPGDTITIDARLHGDHRGFRYAIEGAYQTGRVADFHEIDDLSAFAVAVRAELETGLPGALTFGGVASFATGDETFDDEVQSRFDPLFAEQHRHHGLLDAYAWSNLIEAGGDVSIRPFEPLRLHAGYRLAMLVDPSGQWTSESLQPIGYASGNEERLLGHEIDASILVEPLPPLRFEAGYAIMLLGDGAKAIYEAAERTSVDTIQLAYLRGEVRFP